MRDDDEFEVLDKIDNSKSRKSFRTILNSKKLDDFELEEAMMEENFL